MPAVCCECLSSSLFSDPKELKRLRRNWLNQFAVSSLGGLCYFISIPSLHQFVTSSSTPADPNVSSRVRSVYCTTDLTRLYIIYIYPSNGVHY